MKTLAQSTGEQSTATGLLLVCGALGSLCNTLVLLILVATHPDYNAWQIPDSSLEPGPGGWIQITNYIVSGLLLLAFAIGLRRVLRTGRSSTWGSHPARPLWPQLHRDWDLRDRPGAGYPSGASSITTIPGTIHNLFGQLQFISLAAACFVLARREAADPASRGWAWYAFATGLLVAASDIVFVLTFKVLDGGPVGLIARIGIIVSRCWVA